MNPDTQGLLLFLGPLAYLAGIFVACAVADGWGQTAQRVARIRLFSPLWPLLLLWNVWRGAMFLGECISYTWTDAFPPSPSDAKIDQRGQELREAQDEVERFLEGKR